MEGIIDAVAVNILAKLVGIKGAVVVLACGAGVGVNR